MTFASLFYPALLTFAPYFYTTLSPTPFIGTLHPSSLIFASFLAAYKAALALSGSNDDDYAEAQYWIGALPTPFTRDICIIFDTTLNPTPFIGTLHPL
jgi:hypothetical protein